MTKMVDIERFKNKYSHRIGTQFDNAIFVAENEFLINAYTKADIASILDKIRTEIEKQEKWLLQAGYTEYNVDIALDTIKAVIAESEKI